MDNQVYQQIYDLELRHWWFQGRRKIIFDLIRRTIGSGARAVLDIGCGTGLNAELFRRLGARVTGLESSDVAIAQAKERFPELNIIKGEFPGVTLDDRFQIVTLFDVLEHFQDDLAALQGVYSLLEDGGYAVVTVPAFSFLWTEHDELAHHKRRYTKLFLQNRLEESGFSVVRASYFNTLLFCPILVIRILRKLFRLRKGSSDFFMVPDFFNKILASLFGAERFLLRLINLPFGVSIIAIARKQC